MIIPVASLILTVISLTLAVALDSPLLHMLTARLSWWCVPVASVLWWTAGIGRYLKMPHGWPIASLMAVLSALLMLSAIYLVHPDLVISWLLSR